jgi:hypothetical protein
VKAVPSSRRRLSDLNADLLAASAEGAPATTAGTGLPALEASLAIHGTIPPGLKWDCGLLAATGTDHTSTLRCAALVSSAA